jgi:exopolysaccharide biosynthesis polyprenyl glycosylphosphotransferase
VTSDRRRLFKILRLAFDLGLVVAAYALLRLSATCCGNPLGLEITWHSDYLFRLPAYLTLCWAFAFLASGAYDRDTRRVGLAGALWSVAKVGALMLAVFVLGLFVAKIGYVSRKFLGVYMLLCWFALGMSKWSELRALRGMRRLGFNTLSVILVGEGAELKRALAVYEAHPEWGYRVAGALGLVSAHERSAGPRSLGKLDDLEEVLRTRVVDELVFAAAPQHVAALRRTLETAGLAGVPVRVLLDAAFGAGASVERLGADLCLVARQDSRNPYSLMAKGIFDRTAALLALLLLSPLLLAISVGVLLSSGWPIFFVQKRAGLKGRVFFLYKFRTMVQGARGLQSGLGGANEMDGPVFKVKDDPRVTPLGRFLRRSTLDELPQFFNVLRGEMSLVGPRPLANYEARKVPHWARRRSSVKPGLTCYWQVMGRNKLSFEQWMRLDLRYIDEWSLGLDLSLLLRTVPALLFSRGAY